MSANPTSYVVVISRRKRNGDDSDERSGVNPSAVQTQSGQRSSSPTFNNDLHAATPTAFEEAE
ncbi:hypothetical protein LBMAG21_10370 [Armatimonadota bacterium]|nr:hypothetical protein LBMAG21_10370 [Armatimonadota bacterium]